MLEIDSHEREALLQGLPTIDFGEECPSKQKADVLRNSQFAVYHGAKELFDSFDPNKIGLHSEISGKGIYTTVDRRQAEAYSLIRLGNSRATPVVITFVPEKQKLLDLRTYYKEGAKEGLPKDFLVGFANYLEKLADEIANIDSKNHRIQMLQSMSRRIKYFTHIGQQIYPQDLKENFRITMLRTGRLPIVEALKAYINDNDLFHPLEQLMSIEYTMSCFGDFIMTLGISGLIAPEGGESHADNAGRVEAKNIDAYVFLDTERIKTPLEWEKQNNK